ncbi:MAG TPA: NACHT domain-containing protein [Pyrinomonadaceae bacterium]|nr:NACHT domain-containing protein [Pyrinomonadaceae bacterium]
MTTNLNVDLRELFVMPRFSVRPRRKAGEDGGELDAEAMMNLSAARAVFGEGERGEAPPDADKGVAAVEQVRRSPRNVVVGVPGSGKSTFFEWLQLGVANVDEELIAGSGQAIPLLLRVRQLDPKKLPSGAELIEKATASRDRATLMPDGWIHRQMNAGRVLFMLDGLDETETSIRDDYILPWLAGLCKKYPDCLYLVSSRPVGYPPGTLRKLKFAECDLQDFREPEIAEYTRHWCTAIRLAQNEPDEEARREGAKEGEQIVAGFKDHPYIRNLARNPLMLSAVCLVNYFEGGQLPKDRAVLYKLCVEGLLHHWDQRRGIRSEYSLEEKLRVSREVALAMQSDDRAEYEAAKVLKIFADVLKDEDRAKKLLEHIRYRTGLLIERRAGVFAFAHLTFQEYLAARAIYEGNHLGMDANQLAQEHDDGRWNEVIALYCGLAPAKAVRKMIENLIKQPDTQSLAEVLAESFLSSSSELSQDIQLRKKLLGRIAVAPAYGTALRRFPAEEVAPVANSFVGKIISNERMSESHDWLFKNHEYINWPQLTKHLRGWRKLTPVQACELIYLTHRHGEDNILAEIATELDMYEAPGPRFGDDVFYETQAEIALLGLSIHLNAGGQQEHNSIGAENALLQILRVISRQEKLDDFCLYELISIFGRGGVLQYPKNVKTWREFISLTQQISARFEKGKEFDLSSTNTEVSIVLRNWAARLQRAMKGTPEQKVKSSSKESTRSPKRRASTKRAAKKPTGRRKKS